jgi:hypothetical protein
MAEKSSATNKKTGVPTAEKVSKNIPATIDFVTVLCYNIFDYDTHRHFAHFYMKMERS